MMRLLILLDAVMLCALLAAMFACAICLIAALYPPTRPAVTGRSFLMMTTWGTAFIFACALIPFYL